MIAVKTKNLRHTYSGGRKTDPVEALKGIDIEIEMGCVFGFLGPNGSGKTTLFKILSTLLPLDKGEVSIFGIDLKREQYKVREKIGVVFQSPSLDRRLTVRENLKHQGHLYGLTGSELQLRIDEALEKFNLVEKGDVITENLSGGQKRRVEIAKGLMHHPELLIMDEPSTGLDLGARRLLWEVINTLKKDGVTVLLTTHLMLEAELCDRLAIIDLGKTVSVGTPDEMKKRIGGDIITIQTPDPERFLESYREKFGETPLLVNGKVRIEKERGHEFIPRIVESFPGMVTGVGFGKPTLEDVFISTTGRAFVPETEEVE
jgi:ABC-2 type transport system ATP-binding protein